MQRWPRPGLKFANTAFLHLFVISGVRSGQLPSLFFQIPRKSGALIRTHEELDNLEMKEMQESNNYVLFCAILSPANDRLLARNYLCAGRC